MPAREIPGLLLAEVEESLFLLVKTDKIAESGHQAKLRLKPPSI